MIAIDGQTIRFGDFHGQWNEDRENPALLIAGLSHYGYDFSVFQGPGPAVCVQRMATALKAPTRFFGGRECMFDWAHVTTWDLRGEPPPIDTPDFRAVLADMKRRARMLILAHPCEPFIPYLASLLDEGLIDAVEIVNDGPAQLDRNKPILRWYEEQVRLGRRVPIVGGMDIHLAKGCQRPNVSYSQEYTPQNDFSALDRNRTAVLAADGTPEAIVAAVKSGRALVEAGGELIGPPDLVRALESGGYWAARTRAQARLNRMALCVERAGPLVAGRKELLAPEPGHGDVATLRVFDGQGVSVHAWRRDQGPLPLSPPHIYDRNLFHLGASVEAVDGVVKTFALKVFSPVEMRVEAEPGLRGAHQVSLGLINRSDEPISGQLECQTQPGAPAERETFALGGGMGQTTRFKVPESAAADPSCTLPVEVRILLADGTQRLARRRLAFVGAAYLAQDDPAGWRDIPKILIGRADQIDPAWTSQWRGPEDCSAEVQLAWSEAALHIRARIRDDVLCPSPQPRLPTFGDALQIGINPLNRSDVPAFGVYNFVLTRHRRGDALWLDGSPGIACEGIFRRVQHMPLPASLFRNEAVSDTETLCRINLPWHWLIPMQPLPGYRFGLYMLLWDNDGQGCKAELCWPLCAETELGCPWYNVSHGAWADVTLWPKDR